MARKRQYWCFSRSFGSFFLILVLVSITVVRLTSGQMTWRWGILLTSYMFLLLTSYMFLLRDVTLGRSVQKLAILQHYKLLFTGSKYPKKIWLYVLITITGSVTFSANESRIAADCRSCTQIRRMTRTDAAWPSMREVARRSLRIACAWCDTARFCSFTPTSSIDNVAEYFEAASSNPPVPASVGRASSTTSSASFVGCLQQRSVSMYVCMYTGDTPYNGARYNVRCSPQKQYTFIMKRVLIGSKHPKHI